MNDPNKQVGNIDRNEKPRLAALLAASEPPKAASLEFRDSAPSSSAQPDGRTAVDAQKAATGNDTSCDELDHLTGVLIGVSTALWRARAKLCSQGQSALPSELRLLSRHLDAAWDALTAGGFAIQDPKDQRYVPGMAVNPIAFQPTEGIRCEVIQEVLKPSIFYRDVLIQRADVIVAIPASDSFEPAEESASGPPSTSQ